MKTKNKAATGLFQINVPVGNLPPQKAKEYTEKIAKEVGKTMKKHGDFIVTPFRGDGKVEIIRII
jgi:hypothetical protein